MSSEITELSAPLLCEYDSDSTQTCCRIPPKSAVASDNDDRERLCSRSFWNSCSCTAVSGVVANTVATCSLKVLGSYMSAFQILCFQSSIALPFLLCISYCETGTVLPPRGLRLVIGVRGILGAIDFVTCTIGVTLIPLSVAGLLMNMHTGNISTLRIHSPAAPAPFTVLAFVAGFLWILGKERLTSKTLLGIAGTVVGPAFTLQPSVIFEGDGRLNSAVVVGSLLFLVGVLCRSVGFILVTYSMLHFQSLVLLRNSECREVGTNASSALMSVSVAAPILISSAPFLFTQYPRPFRSTLSSSDILLCCLCSIEWLNQLFLVRSFQIGPPLKASVLSLFRIMSIAAVGVLVFGESVSFYYMVGFILLCLSFILIVVNRDPVRNKWDSIDESIDSKEEDFIPSEKELVSSPV